MILNNQHYTYSKPKFKVISKIKKDEFKLCESVFKINLYIDFLNNYEIFFSKLKIIR